MTDLADFQMHLFQIVPDKAAESFRIELFLYHLSIGHSLEKAI